MKEPVLSSCVLTTVVGGCVVLQVSEIAWHTHAIDISDTSAMLGMESECLIFLATLYY